jgi:hypothetical protein
VRIFHIDLEANDAALQLLAIMCWPRNPKAREHFLVKAALQNMDAVENRITEAAHQVLRRTLELQLPQLPNGTSESVAEALAEDLASKTARQASEVVRGINTEIDALYLRPYGGKGRLVSAPAMESILQAAMAEGGKYGTACGEILFNIVTLHKHHPDLRASKRRAMYIMVRCARDEGRDIPADRDRKTMWETWGPVAPLWAARIVCRSAAREQGVSRFGSMPFISCSLWFADFAVKFEARGAKESLLSEDKVIRVNPELDPVEPNLPPFDGKRLIYAHAYKVA